MEGVDEDGELEDSHGPLVATPALAKRGGSASAEPHRCVLPDETSSGVGSALGLEASIGGHSTVGSLTALERQSECWPE